MEDSSRYRLITMENLKYSKVDQNKRHNDAATVASVQTEVFPALL